MNALVERAIEARENSYSPYSRHPVGAALKTADGKIYGGCNIENSSFGGTVCAERTAVWKAVSEGSVLIREIAVVTDSQPPWPPCGLCLQVLSEFAAPDLIVHLANLKGEVETLPFQKLLPRAFTPSFLHQNPES